MLGLLFIIAIVGHSATIDVPMDYKTIQDGIKAAVKGDTVLVAPGAYVENIDLLGKAITLRSEMGPGNTLIDGKNNGPVVICQTYEGRETIIEGFTITNGSGALFGGCIRGGGMLNINSSPSIFNCVFIKNNLSPHNFSSGGGMCNWHHSNPLVVNCRFIENCALATQSSGGGGMDNVSSNPTLKNCVFLDNLSSYGGGGVSNGTNSDPTLINCTFCGNSAAVDGGALYNSKTSQPKIINCILWNDSPNEIYCDPGGSCAITFSDIRGGYPGMGNIDADPIFVAIHNQDFHLSHISPCIDSGDNIVVTELSDFEGDPRIVNGKADMGADEFHTHLYYTGNPTPGNNISLNFIDTPNTSPVVLWLGSGVLKNPIKLPPYGDWHLKFPILVHAQLGSIPSPHGVLSAPCFIPTNLPPADLPLQAGIGMKLTNLLSLKIQ